MSVEVRQADIEAAREYEPISVQRFEDEGMIRDHSLVLLIASVRHQAEESMRERAARELDQRAERARVAAIGGGMDPMDAQLLDYEYSNAAAAIRSIDMRGE